jgi:hypothetical protein
MASSFFVLASCISSRSRRIDQPYRDAFGFIDIPQPHTTAPAAFRQYQDRQPRQLSRCGPDLSNGSSV